MKWSSDIINYKPLANTIPMKGGNSMENAKSNSNPIGDRLWLEHFARVLHREYFSDEEYSRLLSLIDREMLRRHKGRG